jgi:hypothetical protein
VSRETKWYVTDLCKSPLDELMCALGAIVPIKLSLNLIGTMAVHFDSLLYYKLFIKQYVLSVLIYVLKFGNSF